MTLNNEQLEAIRKRAEAATEGPWELDEDDFGLWNRNGRNYIGSIGKSMADSDAEFIAHAREDVPALLSLVAQQRAEVERLRNEISFIANVDMSRAYDADHVIVSVKGWAHRALNGGANE
ncbi:hypothetical protein [Heyndrickxia sporothermodurans]|uniref:hypothetical protein n=1 Tax=Heyndrickxia sporothermodurans TaxID=46224 RepID=UPI002E1D8B81|nr:hypothetical protein [Heyndrickxia sporothermodurans]MED3697987.1 hypothetical protein [Heyndrickxia sporothermodurans]